MITPRVRRHFASFLCSGVVVLALAGQGRAQGSRADYERSANLRRTTANTVFRDRVEPHWLPGNTRFWYDVRTGPGTREYVLVDAKKGVRQLAFDHARLAAALRQAGAGDIQPGNLALRDLEWPDADTLLVTAARKRWRVALENYAAREVPMPPAAAHIALLKKDSS